MPKLRAEWSVACLALLLAACAPLAPKQALSLAVPTPANWSASDPCADSCTTPLARWWLQFNDPLMARLVEEALRANTSVQDAQAALRQARAQRDVSAAGLLPTLGSSASAQASKSGSNSTQKSFGVGLDAGWEIDIFGGNRSAVDAADASARASAASLGDVQVSIAAEVALAYITLRSAQLRLAIANDNLASQQETLQITQWRLQAGLVSSLEAEQATASTAQTRAQLPALQSAIAQAGNALAVLTGQAPGALSPLLAQTGALPMAADTLALAMPAETLRQRPDVRAAEHQATAALARVAQADAARLPSFRLSGSLGLSALTLGGLTANPVLARALMAAVSWPVFDGGASRAQVLAQQAALDQARASWQGVVLKALKEVEDALVALRGDRDRLVQLQQAAQAAGNAALLARQRFGSGLVDFQTVLETQRTQLNTQDSVANASADIAADHVRLYKALGGGWQGDASDAAAAAGPTRTSPL